MEIIMISESKLKVMLTSEDLQAFELEAEDLDYGNTETKRMFWDVLGRAKNSVGFDTDGQRVLVQLYPSRAGGCEMFITKLGALSCKKETGENRPDLHTVIQTRPEAKKETEATHPTAFGFESVERLLSVCRRLMSIGYHGRSDAYFGDDRRAYLLLSLPEVSGYLPIDEFSFIGEYGSHENAEALRQYLGEHARPICREEAVEVLSKF